MGYWVNIILKTLEKSKQATPFQPSRSISEGCPQILETGFALTGCFAKHTRSGTAVKEFFQCSHFLFSRYLVTSRKVTVFGGLGDVAGILEELMQDQRQVYAILFNRCRVGGRVKGGGGSLRCGDDDGTFHHAACGSGRPDYGDHDLLCASRRQCDRGRRDRSPALAGPVAQSKGVGIVTAVGQCMGVVMTVLPAVTVMPTLP